MKLKSRNFPHPVLHPTNDDIVKSHFSGNISSVSENSTEFNLQFIVKNDTLNRLFQNGSVHLNAHFECLSTMQRISFEFNYTDFTVEKNKDEQIFITTIFIDSSLINKKVDVNYFILSNTPIPNYSNNQMHPDFAGLTFNIEKGDILALGITQTIHLKKKQLLNTSSIFRVAKGPSTTGPFTIGMQTDQIEIIFPESIHVQIGQFSQNNDKHANQLLIQMIYYPALVDTLYHLQGMDENDLEEYTARDWYITLERKLQSMGYVINQLGEGAISTIAYKLLYEEADIPWKALENISIGEESEQDDDELDE